MCGTFDLVYMMAKLSTEIIILKKLVLFLIYTHVSETVAIILHFLIY